MMRPVEQLSLADLIRSGRHLIEVRSATPSELASITGDITGITAVKGFLRGWQAIAICDHSEHTFSIHVVGFFGMRSWITSGLLRLATDHSMVRTRNSVYALGQRAEADLSVSHLFTVARALRAGGLVDRYGLDVMRDDDFLEYGIDE